MSRRDQVRMTDAEVESFLVGRHTMNVATHNHDGTIHLVAMWYGFLDGRPVFETYARSQKVLNLQRDNRVTVLVEEGDKYEDLQGVELVGTAEVLDDPDRVIAAATSVVERYMELEKPEDAHAAAVMLANKRVAIVIHAERTVSWDHRKLEGGY